LLRDAHVSRVWPDGVSTIGAVARPPEDFDEQVPPPPPDQFEPESLDPLDEETGPTEWYRRPVVLIGWGLTVLILIALIAYGIIELTHDQGTSKTPSTSTTPTTTATTTLTTPPSATTTTMPPTSSATDAPQQPTQQPSQQQTEEPTRRHHLPPLPPVITVPGGPTITVPPGWR
jgi:hypothetical protein